jgi:hypothetical protein
MMNHIVIIFNVFGVESGLKMLEFKLNNYWHIIKPFLIYLKVINNTKYIDTAMDKTIVNELRKI